MADVVDTIAALRARLTARASHGPVGLVPTMGALHEGHARLIERARAECRTVVVSIFVNPLQFDRPDDLDRYPRTLDADVALCSRFGVDLVFAPPATEIYPEAPRCTIEVGALGEHLCGRFRPGHFQGVATVVMKLLQIAQPDRAYFGEKDAQQLAVIRRLVADFNVPVDVVGVPTVREADGLALSSRNRRLGDTARAHAVVLYELLRAMQQQVEAGATDVPAIRARALEQVRIRGEAKVEYLEVVDPLEMQPLQEVSGPVLAAGAMWLGGVRLIDNVRCEPSNWKRKPS